MSARPPWRNTWRSDDGRRRRAWRTFVHNHAIASIDMFVVPTISFGLLYGLLILRQSRRELLWLGCDSPSHCGMACPSADRGLRLGRASTLLDPRPRGWRCLSSGASGPWAFATGESRRVALAERICERLIGSIRQECLDHVVVGERHLRHALASYQNTTTRSERTYRCRRTRRFGVMCAAQGACVRRRPWAGYTINMFEFEFLTGTGHTSAGPVDGEDHRRPPEHRRRQKRMTCSRLS
jgi:hypothetical protein